MLGRCSYCRLVMGLGVLGLVVSLLSQIIQIHVVVIVTGMMHKGIGRRTSTLLPLSSSTARPSTVRVVDEQKDVN